MTTPLCDSPMVNHYLPSLSSHSHKFLLSFEPFSLKSHLRSAFIHKYPFQFRPRTSKLVHSTKRNALPVASLGGFLGGIFKGTDTGESTRQQYASTVAVINAFEAQMSALSDSQLRDKTSMLKERAQSGESLDSILPVSFVNKYYYNLLFLCLFFAKIFSSTFMRKVLMITVALLVCSLILEVIMSGQLMRKVRFWW